jgi:hypothetical protein
MRHQNLKKLVLMQQVLKPRKLGFTECINLNFLGSNAVAKNKALRYNIET